jgi:hypothetical protein
MQSKCLHASFAAMAMFAASFGAQAADLPAPVYKAATAAAASGGEFYLWVDDSWQSVRLPTYALGMHNHVLGALLDAGPMQSFDPRTGGNGVRGAIGYVLPPGAMPAMFGSNVRLEIGASYVKTSATQSAPVGGGGEAVNLAGQASLFAFNCSAGFSCSTVSTLDTDYRTWQIDGKVASDYRSGAITWTPSLALVGGDSRTSQGLAQALSQFNSGGALVHTAAYGASTLLDWTDVGTRVGLAGRIDVSNWLTFCAGGYVGVVDRRTSLTGSDSFVSSGGVAAVASSSIAAGASTAALVANGELGLEVRVTPKIALKAFAGLNFDGRVPAISAPGFVGPFNPASTPIPAGIFYAAETSYYAGGGVRIKF